MTETSYFWGGTSRGDARLAPYGAEYMDLILAVMATGYDPSSEGIVPYLTSPYSGELKATNPAGNTVRVSGGLAIVDGSVYFNDANVDFTCSVTGFYTIALKKSWRSKTVTLIRKGPYGYTTEEDPTEGPSGRFPACVRAKGFVWEIPIAYIEKPVGLSPVVMDARFYIGCSMSEVIFIPASVGHNGIHFIASSSGYGGILAQDGYVTRINGLYHLPPTVLRDVKITTLVQSLTAEGTIYASSQFIYGTGNIETASFAISPLETDLEIQSIAEINPANLSAWVAANFISMEFTRDATDAKDTIVGDVLLLGWKVQYITAVRVWR